MRSIEQQLLNLEESAVKALVKSHAAKLGDSDPATWTHAEIRAAFEWLHGLSLESAHQQASEVLKKLQVAVGAWHTAHPQDSEAIEFLYEWMLIAIRLTPESREKFVCMPMYERIFEVIELGPVAQHYRLLEARLQLMRHTTFWLERGGKMDKLDEETREFLDDARDGFEAQYEEIVDAAEAREDYDASVLLYRVAAKYYFYTEQPNDGVACMKAALEDLPNTKDYVPQMRAELLLELGQVFHQFKKYAVAIKYFHEAQEIFEAGGEEWETQAIQAETWVETSSKDM